MSTIVCIGDSIVEGEGDELGIGGWVGRLQREMLANTDVGEFRVYSLGVGMETSLDLLHRLHGEVSYRSPDVVILQASHGDSCFHQSLDGEHDFEIGSGARLRTWSRNFSFLQKLQIFGYRIKSGFYECLVQKGRAPASRRYRRIQ